MKTSDEKRTNYPKDLKHTMGRRIEERREELHKKRPAICNAINTLIEKDGSGLNLMLEDRLRKWEVGTNYVATEYIPYICKVLDCDTGYLYDEYPERKREYGNVGEVTGLSYEAIDWLHHLSCDEEPDELSTDTISTLLTVDNAYSLFIQLQHAITKVLLAKSNIIKCRRTCNISDEEKQIAFSALIEQEKQIKYLRYELAVAFERAVDSILDYESLIRDVDSMKKKKVFSALEARKDFGDMLKEDNNV